MPTSQEMPSTQRRSWRWPRLETWHLGLCAGLVLWYALAISLLDQNLYVLAFWYVWNHLLSPLVAISAGWTLHALVHRTYPGTFIGLLLRQAAILLLTVVTLPVLLSAVNRIPFGQNTERWTGKVRASSPAIDFTSASFCLQVQVASDTLGRGLQFFVPEGMLKLRTHPPVRGSVVKGFMGVPVAVRIEDGGPEVSVEEELRGQLAFDPWNDETRKILAKELIGQGRLQEALQVIDATWDATWNERMRNEILKQIPQKVGEWIFMPTKRVREELEAASPARVKQVLARNGERLPEKSWAAYSLQDRLVKVYWFGEDKVTVSGDSH